MTDETRLTDEEILEAVRRVPPPPPGWWIEQTERLVAAVRGLRPLRTADPYTSDKYERWCFWCEATEGEPHKDDCPWVATGP